MQVANKGEIECRSAEKSWRRPSARRRRNPPAGQCRARAIEGAHGQERHRTARARGHVMRRVAVRSTASKAFQISARTPATAPERAASSTTHNAERVCRADTNRNAIRIEAERMQPRSVEPTIVECGDPLLHDDDGTVTRPLRHACGQCEREGERDPAVTRMGGYDLMRAPGRQPARPERRVHIRNPERQNESPVARHRPRGGLDGSKAIARPMRPRQALPDGSTFDLSNTAPKRRERACGRHSSSHERSIFVLIDSAAGTESQVCSRIRHLVHAPEISAPGGPDMPAGNGSAAFFRNRLVSHAIGAERE